MSHCNKSDCTPDNYNWNRRHMTCLLSVDNIGLTKLELLGTAALFDTYYNVIHMCMLMNKYKYACLWLFLGTCKPKLLTLFCRA